MTSERQEILNRMKKIEVYFQQNSSKNVLFKGEYECARAIWQNVGRGIQLMAQDAYGILKLYNEANAGPHYNGSGWMDYQFHLRHLLTVDGYKVCVDASGFMKID